MALAKHYGVRKNIIVPNISWGLLTHECDILVVRPSGIAIEIEIKISVADFKKDLTKRHHHKEGRNRISEFYYAMPKNIYEKVKDLINENAGILVCEKYMHESYSHQPYEEVFIKTIRNAKKIPNARKLTEKEMLKVAHLGCMRIFNLKDKNITLQNRLLKSKK